ncbi:hypothetical protein [Pectobacterium cacticida]|uniref:hypothetical protein n=1 Tax=Pectobacterium cacticida TaxID=69221 RepID=UPI00398720C6
MVSFVSPILFIDYITASSGSMNFGEPPKGKTLKYMSSSMIIETSYISVNPPNISVSGSGITWSNLNGAIFLYWG